MRILVIFLFMSILQYARCDYKLKPEVDIVLMPVSVISASIGNILTYEENMLVEDDFAGIDNLNIPFLIIGTQLIIQLMPT